MDTNDFSSGLIPSHINRETEKDFSQASPEGCHTIFATEQDLSIVFELEKRAFNEEDRCELSHLQYYLHDYPTGFVLLKCGQVLLGYFVCYDDGANGYYIESLAVDPSHRNHGFASYLLNDCILPKAKLLGFQKVTLHVDVENLPANRFYSKNGFEVVARIPAFYDSGHDAWYMEKKLAE